MRVRRIIIRRVVRQQISNLRNRIINILSQSRLALGLRLYYLLRHYLTPSKIREIERRIGSIGETMIGRYPGDTPDKLLLYLMSYVSAMRFAQGDYIHVEIGTLHGGSLIATLMALQDACSLHKVVCIDPLDGYYGHARDPSTGIAVSREIVEQNIDRFNFGNSKIEIVTHYSTELKAIDSVRDSGIISLFIDGDHSYEGVKADWFNYSPFIVPGGYVLFDNYNDPIWPEVTEFIHRELKYFSKEWHIEGSLNRSLLLRRRG